MSWRNVLLQPAAKIHNPADSITASEDLFFILDLAHVLRRYALQEFCRLRQMEFGIARLDTQKEAVRRCPGKPLDVKHRMIRLRQAIQCQHPEYRRKRRSQNGQLEGHWNKRRPAVERPPAHID